MRFQQRFVLAFCPIKGYARLMSASGMGALGAMLTATVVGILFLRLCVALYMLRWTGYIRQTLKALPQFSVDSNGTLIIPTVPQPYVYRTKDFVVVIDTTNRTTLEQMHANFVGSDWYLVTSRYIYDNESAGPDNYLAAIGRVVPQMDNSTAHVLLSVMVSALIYHVVDGLNTLSVVGRIVFMFVLGFILSIIGINGERFPIQVTAKVVAHAMIPATAMQLVLCVIGALAAPVPNPANMPYWILAALFGVSTTVLSLVALCRAEPEYEIVELVRPEQIGADE